MQKRILILASDFPPQLGGVATYSLELAMHFYRRDHEVTLISRTFPIEEPLDLPFEVIRYSIPRSGVAAFFPLARQLRQHLKTRHYDHIFSTLWMPDAAACFIAQWGKKVKIPYSIAVHAMEIIESKENLKKRIRAQLSPLKKKIFRKAHSIFCVSQFSRDLLLGQISQLEGRVHVVNNGADPRKFFPSTQDDPRNTIRLVTVSRLMPNKGIDKILSALPVLKQRFPGIEYHIVGTGPDDSRLKKMVNRLSLEDCVTFTGRIPHQDLVHEIQKADLFVMLSRQERHHVEGFGLVFLEAALCGTPSLGGRSGGIPDAIIEDQTGWLVDPEDDQAILKKLTEILDQPHRLKTFGEKARVHTLSHHTWEVAGDKILSYWEKNP